MAGRFFDGYDPSAVEQLLARLDQARGSRDEVQMALAAGINLSIMV